MPKLSSDNLASQRDRAYRSLRRLLILQQIEPGGRLREPHWSQRLGVHRTALREAFARLAAEGLIDRGERTGYFVPAMTPADLAEITKLRLALECLAIDEVCTAESPDLAPMNQASEEFARFLEGEYSLGAIEADRRFHEALIDAARMRRLSDLYQRAPLPLIHGDVEEPEQWRRACARTLEEHRRILEALRARDAERAKHTLREHLSHLLILPICP
ncbi:GntR family transcriptional regulator [Paludisphaera rhizosphaerae]|uniref:GntR family transcriptional regulator n=1 Tax=Paludisphaera rhizosphaerae TaxID=2711216 RepID=UPI0013ED9DAE|nr:GntR family transcriptional regulator [Paludisphaera rhizosphaerae]